MGVEWVCTFRPRTVIPVLYDDYGVFRSPVTDFLARLRAADSDVRLVVLERGERAVLVA